jgi:hypothetical protein
MFSENFEWDVDLLGAQVNRRGNTIMLDATIAQLAEMVRKRRVVRKVIRQSCAQLMPAASWRSDGGLTL